MCPNARGRVVFGYSVIIRSRDQTGINHQYALWTILRTLPSHRGCQTVALTPVRLRSPAIFRTTHVRQLNPFLLFAVL